MHERRYLSPRPPPISSKHYHDWTKGNDQLGSTVEHRPVGKLVQQSLGEALQAGSSKPTQSKPIQLVIERGNLWSKKTRPAQERLIVGKCLQKELDSFDRTGKPVKCEDNRVMQVHDRTGKPVESRTHTQSARSWFSRTS